MAAEFVRLLGLAGKIKINKVPSDFFKAEYFAPRPESERLVNLKLDCRGLNVMRHWKAALEDYSAVFSAELLRLDPLSRRAAKVPV